MSIKNSFFPFMLLPDFAVKVVFQHTGELSNLTKVCRFFKYFSEDEARRVYNRLVNEYGLQFVDYAFMVLKVADKSLPAKIDALFYRANKHFTGSEGEKTSCSVGISPYGTAHIAEYMERLVEAQSMEIFWSAIYTSADPFLKEIMGMQRFSSDPLVCLKEKQVFFEKNRRAFLAFEKLQLENTGLMILPKEIAYFSNLKSLNLSGNQLFKLPPEISFLKKLNYLYASDNRLSTLPPEIGELTSLNGLSANNNCIRHLPVEIGKLSQLRILALSMNQIDHLPNEIGNLTSLCSLCLESNFLLALPATIGNLQNLQFLYLYNNQILSLPSKIGELSSLKVLSAPHNQMVELPEQINGLENLQILMLDHNCLRSLPEAIVELSSLQELHINGNQIVSLPMLPRLRNLGFEGNYCVPPKSTSLERVESATRFHDVYGMLEGNKWREFVDGAYHRFGEMVFDEGRHGRCSEPGFAGSMHNLFDFLTVNVDRRLDAAFYLEMHRIACAHFNGAATQTLIGQEGVGVFRNGGVSAAFPAPHYAISKEAYKEFYLLNMRLRRIFGNSFSLGNMVVSSHFPLIWKIDYSPLSSDQVEMVFNLFLSDFYSEMNGASSSEDVLTAIAKLIQHLEWLHPPKDGCGRTDTALLNFLLSKYGLSPVLLEFPYVSSCRGLNEWVWHLKKGMEAWSNAVMATRFFKQSF